MFKDEYVENIVSPLILKPGFEYMLCLEYKCCERIRYPLQEKTGIYLSVLAQE